MNIIRLLILSLCLLFAGVSAYAEQRAIVVTGYSDYQCSKIDLSLAPITSLLREGWRVTSQSSSATVASNGTRQYIIIFVLESPAPSPLVNDMKRLWQRAYDQCAGRGVSDNTAREFADRVVAVVAQESKP